MKKPRPTVVEKIKAAQAAPAAPPSAPVLPVAFPDLANLIFAARRALPHLSGQDFVNVCNSIVNGETLLARAQQPPVNSPAETAPDPK